MTFSRTADSLPAAQPAGETGKIQHVEHAAGRNATLARHLNAPVSEIDFGGRVGVRIDAHHAAQFERAAVPTPVEIKTPRVRIDLDRDAMLGACSKDLFDVY